MKLKLPIRSRSGARSAAGVSIPSEIALEGVGRRYGERRALSDIDLRIKRSEVLCLLGPSGCGKSTMLRVISGLVAPSEGRVEIDGRLVASPTVSLPPEKRGVGMIFQDYALFPHLSVLQNVAFGLRRLGRCAAREAALAALERVGMDGYATTYPHQLSGGEQQRVALARAVAPRPGVLLMDEPFSGLDARLRDRVREETRSVLRETKATCILVTHDPQEAMKFASRIALLRHGRLVQAGTPRAVYEAPHDMAAARFFGEMTELRVQARDGVVDWPFPGVETRLSGPIDVGIRPEGVILLAPGRGVAGRALNVQFIGDLEIIELAVQGVEGTVTARRRATGTVVPGQDVSVAVSPSHVLVFPAEPA